MPTTSEYLTAYVKAKEQGPRGFPGPPGPVSGGVYPSAGVAVSTGAAWATSYTTSGTGTVLALTAGPTFSGTVTVGASVVVPDGGTIGQAAGPLLTFDDTNNYLEITGCDIGIGITAPQDKVHIKDNAGCFILEGTDHVYIQWYPDNYAAGRKAYTGFASGADNNFTIANEIAGADILLIPTATGGVGVGTTGPNAKLESLATTEQLRLSYDATHYTKFEVASTGALTMTPLANTNVNIVCSGTGDLTVNTNHLYVDTSESRVGILDTTPSYTLDVNGTGRYTGILYGDSSVQNPAYAAGWVADGGTKWQIDADGDAQFESILCRGGLQVYELIINQIHYQNGGLLIGHGAGKVATIIDATQGAEIITIEDPEGNTNVPFTVGSIVIVQRVDLNRTTVVKKLVRKVDAIAGTQITLGAIVGWNPAVNDTGAFDIGDEMCAIGHITTAALQNSIFITATETNNPYLAVFTEVDSYADWLSNSRLKLLIGNLAKIASATYGDLTLPASPGYGFFSDNCYLSGKIVATSGLIGGFTIDSTEGLYAGSGATRVQMKPGAGFWAGATAIGDAPFSVTEAGALTATGALELGTAAVSYAGDLFNVAIKGADIYEASFNNDGGNVYINRVGYQGGTTKYRTFTVCNGKSNMLADFVGADDEIIFYSVIRCQPRADPPASAQEGQIYADTDHHLYYYNGSTWKQLDN